MPQTPDIKRILTPWQDSGLSWLPRRSTHTGKWIWLNQYFIRYSSIIFGHYSVIDRTEVISDIELAQLKLTGTEHEELLK